MLHVKSISVKGKCCIVCDSESPQSGIVATVETIDQLLSDEWHEDLRIVRRMLTGSIPRMETNETQSAV